MLSITLYMIKLDDVSEAECTFIIWYKTGKGPIQLRVDYNILLSYFTSMSVATT
jgi:hypothetical protein